MAAVLLQEGQQLLPRALCRQGLQHLGEAWQPTREGREEGGGGGGGGGGGEKGEVRCYVRLVWPVVGTYRLDEDCEFCLIFCLVFFL